MNHPVVELIADRLATGSEPGARTDGERLALAIQGGSSRGTYSSGMTLAIEELGLLGCFDAVYGSSMGALNGAWLLCGRAGRGISTWWDPAVMRRILNPWGPLHGRPVVDTDYLVHSVYSRLQPMDFPAILDNPVTFHPLGTDADTGESTDLHPFVEDEDTLKRSLRATASIPILAGRPIELGGRRFVDAGIAEPLPYRTALQQGATRVLMLRTRRADELPIRPPRLYDVVVPRFLQRHAPGAIDAWRAQYELEISDEDFLASGGDAVLTIRPPLDSPDVGLLEREPDLLKRAVMLGREAARTALAA